MVETIQCYFQGFDIDVLSRRFYACRCEYRYGYRSTLMSCLWRLRQYCRYSTNRLEKEKTNQNQRGEEEYQCLIFDSWEQWEVYGMGSKI